MSLACTSVAERLCIEAKLSGRLTPVRAADVVGQARGNACRADNDTTGIADADLVQQVGPRQRRERVTTQVGEVRVRPHILAA